MVSREDHAKAEPGLVESFDDVREFLQLFCLQLNLILILLHVTSVSTDMHRWLANTLSRSSLKDSNSSFIFRLLAVLGRSKLSCC